MNDYFQLFGLPERYDINLSELTQTYRRLAARFHPDQFAAASAFEKKQAMMMTATLNEAYTVLQNPLDRAAYLLKKQGIDADAPEHTHFAPEFLMQQMQWRETLAESTMEHDTAALHHLAQTIESEKNQLYNQLHTAFEQQQFDQAGEYVRQGRFLHKLMQEIRAASD